MTYQLQIVADTKDEADKKGQEAVKKIDFMRQPHVESLRQRDDGKWVCLIKYWGLD